MPSARGRGRRRFLTAVLGVLAIVTGPLVVFSAPLAAAGPVDTPWTASGPTGTFDVPSDGTENVPQMTYSMDPAGLSEPREWEFTAHATPESAASPIKVPYTWQGLHAWFQVETQLDMIVNDVVVDNLVMEGPVNCCQRPSNGFIYGGIATFNVGPTDTYGFRLTGSNWDSNNILQGTFTLSTKPYVDATIGTDNRDWPGATELFPEPDPEPATTTSASTTGVLEQASEARWYKFEVVPGQAVTVTLDQLEHDYDVALYGDIDAAYQLLSSGDEVSSLAAGSAGVPVGEAQVPTFPDEYTTIPTKDDPPTGQQFAPRVYAPRVYAPRVYAPRVYAPRVYAPRVYAPRVYAPSNYAPDLFSDESFQQAFSAAQNQTLLAVSARPAEATETATAEAGNTAGFFYVRVQGHTDDDFHASDDFRLTVTLGDTACDDMSIHSGLTLLPDVDPGAPAAPTTVIVTDTSRVTYDGVTQTAFVDGLAALAADSSGVVVDLAGSPRVQKLWEQAQAANRADCPYAVNLVAAAIDEIVESFDNPGSKYVVIAGGDDVVPFFRYPDVSGLGQESQFEPPMRPGTPSFGSLDQDQVLSQDAYGSDVDVTVGGATLPVPELAVGRLVKTASEMASTIDRYLAPGGRTLPTPQRSLVTGYDFLVDAARAVNDEFTAALGPEASTGAADTLISDPADPGDVPWNATQLEEKLLGPTRHDVVFLAGHFSANDTLAADFTSTLNAELLDPDPLQEPAFGKYADRLEDVLVLSVGCHSGYPIVDNESVPFVTETGDWTQRMAQQHAVLIGGTGYQYGDTDFLEYSERLYLEVARRLHEGPASGPADPVAIGSALALAKQDYLAGLTTLTGIDQKAYLEATLYGLPMTGFDAPGRTPLDHGSAQTAPPVVDADPGHTLGLRVVDRNYPTPMRERHKTVTTDEGDELELTWYEHARDGVAVQPGLPALPKQVENVSVEGQVLRGVGFVGGTYSDLTGQLPLTGAPAIEASTPNSTFDSEFFFPQKLTTVNYFGALAGGSRTSLVLTPAQYRTDEGADPNGIPTNTVRRFGELDVRMFYSGEDGSDFGGNRPALAAPPGIGNVTGTVDGNVVTFSANVTGDPSAGVQQAWVTWTGTDPTDSGHGSWQSVEMAQDPTDSTRWIGTLVLDGQSADGLRFIVQAASGVGAVSLDTAEGDGYGVVPAGFIDTASVSLETGAQTSASPLGVTAVVTAEAPQSVAERAVRFTVLRGGLTVYQADAETDEQGRVSLPLPVGRSAPPGGDLTVVAFIFEPSGQVKDSAEVSRTFQGVTITPTPTSLTTLAGDPFPALSIRLADPTLPVAQVPVTFTLPPASTPNAPGASFEGGGTTATVGTNLNGVVEVPPITAGDRVGVFELTVTTAGAAPFKVVMASQYAFSPFVAPVINGGVTPSGGSTPIKATALLADNAPLSDSAAAALVRDGRVQVRWRETSSSGDWTARTNLATYDAKKGFFQADLKPAELAMIRGRTYTVTLRILPATTDSKPPGYDATNGSFDLGSRSLTLLITK